MEIQSEYGIIIPSWILINMKFSFRSIQEYTANLVAANMLLQSDTEGK